MPDDPTILKKTIHVIALPNTQVEVEWISDKGVVLYTRVYQRPAGPIDPSPKTDYPLECRHGKSFDEPCALCVLQP